jgi:hypothetical protein
MTQAQLERAVCRATGESRACIRRIGFSLLPCPSDKQLPPSQPQSGQRLKVIRVVHRPGAQAA